jgi:glycosyltransferase involved in cell wall biosynthesis
MMQVDGPDISIVVPAWNEEGNLEKLKATLIATLESLGREFEILFIDDGSTDGTFDLIARFAREDPRIRGLRMRKNVGKSNALAAGFESSRGRMVITLDADNQDDPSEIPRFLAKLEEGYDLVSGWKKVRHDPSSRVRASHLFNAVIRKLSGIPLHDFNCGYKAYRSEVVKAVPLYGEWHRFIPVLAADRGFRVTEVEVHHHPRTHGKSRYGFERYFRGFADCLAMQVVSRYRERPGHLFLGIGFTLLAIDVVLRFVTGLVASNADWMGSGWMGTPWLRFLMQVFFTVPFFVVGIQSILTGLLAELLVSRNPPRRHRTAVAEEVGALAEDGKRS